MQLSENLLEPKQQDAIDRLFSFDETILIAATGDGKTVICLTAIKELIDAKHLKRVIVACPAKVVANWPHEATKWEHLKGLGVAALIGDKHQRLERMDRPSDVIVVSLNNLEWLLDQDHRCDGVIIDELSKAAGKQARGLNNKRKADQIKWRVGMTATPVSQDFEKLSSMCKIIDRGKALGTNKDGYLQKYFYLDYNGHNGTMNPGSDKIIMGKIKSLVHYVEDTKAAELPPLNNHIVRFEMPDNTREKYEELKADMVVGDMEAVNKAVQSGKLRQLASGFYYQQTGVTKSGAPINITVGLDTSRVQEAEHWLENIGRPVIIFYEFEAQGLDLLLALEGNYLVTQDVDDFKKDKHDVLLAQINSLSHGTDGLQYICHDVLHYHPFWSRDATTQSRDRLWRKGQKHTVNLTTLVCDDTLDDVVVARVEGRGVWMNLFTEHLES